MEKNTAESDRDWKDSEELVRAATKKMSDLAGSLDGWKSAGEKENVKIYTRFTDDSPIKMIRAETFGIPASNKRMAKFLGGITYLNVMDPMAMQDELKILETYHKGRFMVYAAYKMMWPIWSRDFVWYEFNTNIDDGRIIIAAFNASPRDAPPRDGFVRGFIRESGYIISEHPGDPRKCDVTTILQVDPKGLIPTAIVNMVATDQALNLARARRYFEHGGEDAQPTEDCSDIEDEAFLWKSGKKKTKTKEKSSKTLQH